MGTTQFTITPSGPSESNVEAEFFSAPLASGLIGSAVTRSRFLEITETEKVTKRRAKRMIDRFCHGLSGGADAGGSNASTAKRGPSITKPISAASITWFRVTLRM